MLRRFLCAMLLLPLFAMSAPAASESDSYAPPYPALEWQVTIRSPKDFIARLDTAVSTVTERTRSAVPPNFIPMMIMMQAPLAEVILSSEVPWHFFLADSEFMIVVGEPFDQFRATLEAQKVEFAAEPDGDIFSGRIPEMGQTFFGGTDRYMVMSGSKGPVEKFLLHAADWDPSYRYPGEAFVTGHIPRHWLYQIPKVREILDTLVDLHAKRTGEERAAMLEHFVELGFNPTVLDGFAALLEQYMPTIIAEVDKAKNATLILGMDEDRLGLDWRLSFDEPSFGADAIAHLETAETVDPARMRLPDGAIFAGISVPPDALIADYAGAVRRLNTEIGETMFPEFQDRLSEITEKSLEVRFGHYLTAVYGRPDGQVSVAWMESDNPQAVMSLQREAMDLFNDLFAHTVLNPDFKWAITTTDGVTAGGIPYVQTAISADNVAGLADAIGDLDESTHLALDMLSRFRQYTGVADGVVVTVSGVATEEDFVTAINKAGSLGSSADLPTAAKKAIEAVQEESRMLVLVDFDAGFLAYGRQMAAMADLEIGEPLFADHLESLLDDIDESESYGAIGYGATDGTLFMNISLPLDGINTAWRNGELFYYTLQAKQAETELQDDEDAPDEDEGEEEDLDEPAGAA